MTTDTYTQTSYPGYKIGVPGERADNGPYDAKSLAALENMLAGKGWCFSDDGLGNAGRHPHRNRITTTLSGDTTAAISVTITKTKKDGTEDGLVEVVAFTEAFDTDHDTTMDALMVTISADDDLAAVLNDVGTNKRIVQITATNDTEIAITTAWASTGLTFTNVNTSVDVIAGAVSVDFAEAKDADGNAYVPAGSQFAGVMVGSMYIEPASDISKTDTLYCFFLDSGTDGEERGSFVNAAGSPVEAIAVSTPIKILRPASAAGEIGEIDINTKGNV